MQQKPSLLKLIPLSLLLGIASGVIVYIFLRVLGLGTELLWDTIPEIISFKFYPLIICTIGGLIVGIFRKKFGDYPEEMMVVLGKVRKDKWYDYKKLPVLLVAAFLPLVFASSVGPEAGLVGIITAICYWVAATLKKSNADTPLGKVTKDITYGFAIALGLGTYLALNRLLGAAMGGFPTFELALPTGKDFIFTIIYILVGCLLAKFYDVTHHVSHKASTKLPSILKETVAGLILGLAASFVPQMMFSGEEEIHHLMTEYVEYIPWVLLGIAFLKVLITNICIQGGLKGGHFFPLIYACVALGYAVAMILFPEAASEHVIYAAAMVTAALLGANMKQPIIVALLLLLCFPFRMIIWVLLSAYAGSAITSIGCKEKDAK